MREDALFSKAIERDQSDPLRDFTHHFELPTGIIYLDGNSLGALPKGTGARVDQAVRQEWGRRLIQSWNENWIQVPSRIAAKIALLIGADPDEVLVCDSTSVNYYKLICAGMKYQAGRRKVLAEVNSFPSNNYVLQGALGESQIQYIHSDDGIHTWPEEVESLLDSDVAVMCLNHVNFRTAWLHDMGRLNESARRVGALNLWDLSHSVGVVPIDVHATDTDFAVGCTYKYLNGGPGAPAFLYVRKELQEQVFNPIQGWFGQRDFFEFSNQYQPDDGIRRFNAGTPVILSMVAIEIGVDVVLAAGVNRIREKSTALTDYLIEVYEQKLSRNGVRLNTPRKAEHRGSHVSLGHDRALEIDSALIKRMGVIPDFRSPDNIRFGLSPLYNKFADVYEALDRMRLILENDSYEAFDPELGEVT